MICSNLTTIKKKITAAAQGCNRNPGDVRLVAVSKKMDVKLIQQACDCGQILFGENYLQEAKGKINQLDKKLKWHFIGHLQSNKARQAAELFQVIETVDRLKIARLLDKHAGELGKKLDILIQVNIAGEQQKAGISPERTRELITNISELANLHVRGLMMIPPFTKTPEESRPWFHQVKQLSIDLAQKELFHDNESVELSMGMSGDFTVAIEEGATLVRVGTAIFGPRPN